MPLLQSVLEAVAREEYPHQSLLTLMVRSKEVDVMSEVNSRVRDEEGHVTFKSNGTILSSRSFVSYLIFFCYFIGQYIKLIYMNFYKDGASLWTCIISNQ